MNRILRPLYKFPVACFSPGRNLQPCLLYSSSIAPTLWESMGFGGRLKHKKRVLNFSALHLYLCCAELPDHDSIMRELQLTDTFNSFFRVLQLHVWMAMVRLQPEGPDGKYLRDNLLKYMWQDMDKKSKKLGPLSSSSARAEGMQILGEQFRASLYAYDEGLMSDDRVLAGALWRNLFDRNCADASHLEKMVEYVRRQIVHVDRVDSETLFMTGILKFLPIHETPDAFERQNLIIEEIKKR